MRLRGMDEEHLAGLITRFEALVARILHRVAAAVGRLFGQTPGVSADDLAVLRDRWATHVDAELLPALKVVYESAAQGVAGGVSGAGGAVATLSAPDAAAYLAEARNRLVGVGTELWEAARAQLVEGVHAGEDIGQLAARVQAAAGLTEARARQVARTEVIAAHNVASLVQARLLGDPTMVKEWLATPGPDGVGCDQRTRPTHCAANGQRKQVGERFEVGEAYLDIPCDPTGPPDEVIGCRCSVAFDLDDEPALVAAFDEAKHPRGRGGKFAEKAGVGGNILETTFGFGAGDLHLAADGDGVHLGYGTSRSGGLDRAAARELSRLLDIAADSDDRVGVVNSVATYRKGGTTPTGFVQVTHTAGGVDLELLSNDATFNLTHPEARTLSDALVRYSVARRVPTDGGPVDLYLTADRIGMRVPGVGGGHVEVQFDGQSWFRVSTAIDTVWDGFDELGRIADPEQDITRLRVDTNVGSLLVSRSGDDTTRTLTLSAADGGWSVSWPQDVGHPFFDAQRWLEDAAEAVGIFDSSGPYQGGVTVAAAGNGATATRTDGVTLAASGVDVDQWDDGTYTVGWGGGQCEARLTDVEADQLVDAVNEVRAVAEGEEVEASVDTARGETITVSRGDGDDVTLTLAPAGADAASVTLPDGDAYDLSYQLALWLDRAGYYNEHPTDAQALTAARRPWNPDQHPRDPLTGRFIGKGLVPRKSGGEAKSGAIPRPPEPAAPKAGVPAATPEMKDPAASLKAAVASGVKSRKPLSSGATGEVELVTFHDGTRAIHKTSHAQDDADAKREVDAAELAAATASALGVDTPAVVRINDRETYQDYVSSPTAYNDPTMDERTIADLAASPAGRRLGLFDLLIDYDDRSNRDNWALHDGKLMALDHDTAWEASRDPKKPPQEKWALSPFTAHFVVGKKWKPNDLSAVEVADIRARLDGLRPEFERLGRAKWLTFAYARLDAIAAHGQGPAIAASVDRREGFAVADPTQPGGRDQRVPGAVSDVPTGAMVALIPSDIDAARLAVDGGEPVDQLHCTLLYLGDAADIPDPARAAIVDAVRAYVDGWPPVHADGFAVSMFNPPGMQSADDRQRDARIVLGLSGDDLDMVHDMVGEAVSDVAAEPAGFTLAEQHAPWHAHLTLIYTGDPGQVADLVDRVGPITFDRVRVVFAADATDIPLDGDEPPTGKVGDEVTTDAAAAVGAFQSHMPAQLQRYWIRRIAPWGKGSFARCVRQIRRHYPEDPEGTCANLHHEATGRYPGEHKDRDAADVDLDSITSMEANMADMSTPTSTPQLEQGDCPAGQHPDPDGGDCVPDEGMAAAPVEHFHTSVQEGVSTGLRRFAPESITWRDTPFAYHEQVDSSAHSGQPRTVQVGLVTRVERDGDTVHFYGCLDLKSPQGLDYARRLAEGFARWSSVGGDESVKSSNIEFVWPEGADGEDGGLEMLFADPEEIIFHAFRVAEVSAVSVPAMADATVEPTAALLDALAELGVLTAAAVGSHSTGTSDASWDAGANEKRLPSPMPVGTARKIYAWIDDSAVSDGEIPKSGGKFPHHEVSADGTPGAANLTACSTGIGALHGGRGGTAIPDADRKGVYNHLAAHLRAGGQEPPAFDAGPIVAAGYTITIPDCPPASWFTQPTDVTPHGALTITDEGRVYGYVAPAHIAHRSFPTRRVEAPMGRVDYTRWMGGEALVADGGRVLAGPITMECGHLPPTASSDSAVRMEHYDNACSVVAKAAIGEDQHGVWIAGALEPGVTADQVSRMLACRLSGDWAPHPERPGWREFVAALLVPVPGFPMTRSAPSVRVAEGALVASAVPVRLVHSGEDTVDGAGVDLRPALERVARSIGRDTQARMLALRNRVRH